MGVLPADRSRLLQDFDPEYYLTIGEISDGEERDNLVSDQLYRRSRRRRSTRSRLMEADNFRKSNEQKCKFGSRKMRRLENGIFNVWYCFFTGGYFALQNVAAAFLLGLAREEDVCLDWSDLIPPSESAFTKLLADPEKLTMWYDFIEQPDEIQMQILHAYEKKHGDFAYCLAEATDDCDPSGCGPLAEELRFERLDEGLRDVLLCQWPSWVSGDICTHSLRFESLLIWCFRSFKVFAMLGIVVNRRELGLKSVLAVSTGDERSSSCKIAIAQVVIGNCFGIVWAVELRTLSAIDDKLEHFEDELVNYFASKPRGVWKTVLKESFDRLMLRAVAQWLLLRYLSKCLWFVC
ncbi:hypothetical protein D918_05689 [Trichuris suis]|nr:hypothetical protein D918_05689 [Trichuris suis]